MLPRFVLAVLIALVGFFSIPLIVSPGPGEAVAQQIQRVERDNRSFLQRLFGIRRDESRRMPDRRIQRVPRQRQGQPQRRRPAEPPVAAVEVQPKDPDARKLLVIGDFIASGVAWGLEQTFADEPKMQVVDRSDAASGLVRIDQLDWNARLPEMLNEIQPDLIVIVVGANDRQPMRDGARDAIRSDGWERTYAGRVDGLVETMKLYGRPFFWVSTAPMRQAAATADMNYLNGLYRPRVQAGAGHFVDIWNGFADEEGRYITSGPDVEGQTRQLRNSDGINFTRAGRLKLAFYVEREIRRQTGFGSGGIDLLATVTQGHQIEIAPDGTKRLVGPVISLNNPLPGLSRELSGDRVESVTAEDSLQYKMVVRGEALPDVAGRADDFAWPPRPAAVTMPEPRPEPRIYEDGIPIPIARPEIVPN